MYKFKFFYKDSSSRLAFDRNGVSKELSRLKGYVLKNEETVKVLEFFKRNSKADIRIRFDIRNLRLIGKILRFLKNVQSRNIKTYIFINREKL